ncbi:UDP-N-acetylglucosamine 2-epimerase [Pontibacillus halophilus JSM 076056 = DSM 19796]|uniref:UDP-N-acetylglucosamine 2-epimerase n=1 Tax=Pontibacillus halophilus JSM 076056 = DSM 19796 TaxID=1385510 RepID=A0A0A5GMN1_9BACI|nr:UDP-N-acetylglucosamine 2-epimerase (non-hydrolyzing) [Pontibacillus halophilus]KGX92425.1 UDP-N-acetylglucosamine 2-epimerase [Pontibacillus halophilus JSM 076056 = DSM 19796]
MKVMTVLGTRPEIIRLSLIINKLDQLADEHILVHTGQNFTRTLSDVFFEQLGVRKPDYILFQERLSLGSQLARMYEKLEEIMEAEEPDRVLVLGDTNSGLSAILAERMGIPVVHMEAGNRCFDLEVPEEKNRRVIDAVSTLNLPYTPGSRENLLREGVPTDRIYISGNPIYEVLSHYQKEIDRDAILDTLKLKQGDYFLVTIHRAENVDYEDRLHEIVRGLNLVADTHQKRLITSLHPRTKSKLESSPLTLHPLVELHEPFGFFSFVKLEKHAACVLTDSGTVQEECCLFHVPTVTVRKTTERPETIQCGSNMLTGIDAANMLTCVDVMMNQPRNWAFPDGYADEQVSQKVLKLLLGGMKRV